MRTIVIAIILLNLHFGLLAQNEPTLDIVPNPFVDTTSFIFTLPTSDTVSLVVYDRWGQLIDSLVKEQLMPQGTNSVIFVGDTLPEDVYVVVLYVDVNMVSKNFIKLDQLVGFKNDEQEEQYMTIYPNPFNHHAKVQFSSLQHAADLEVYDVTGKKVQSYLVIQTQTYLTINSEEIGAGLFFIRLTDADGIIGSSKIAVLK